MASDSTADLGMRFRNKVAVITGSTAGIGLATAIRLGREGARVVISSRKQSSVDETLALMRKQGIECIGMPCNVSSDEQREALLHYTVQEYKQIDVLILNAVVNPTMGPLLETPPSAMDKILSVNIKAAISLVAAAQPHLTRDAAVLFVSSITAFRPPAPISAYAVSKTALLGVVKALADEMGPSGVRVNGIAPGIVPTKFSSALVATDDLRKQQEAATALGRLGTPDEIAGAAAFLVSSDAAYVTGETLVVAGGMQSRL
eukprot:jgi/Ulvmu1/11762/UM008_0176.1